MIDRKLRLAETCAYITGAAGGLGQAIARRMSEQGARVFLTDHCEPSVLSSLAAEINDERGERVAWFATQDVRNDAMWKSLTAEAAGAMGKLSVLVNNAGVGSRSALEAIELAEWRRIMEINVEAVMLGCKHAMPYLKEAQPASIINISSVAAFRVDPDLIAYNTSKAAVAMLSKSIAIDCTRSGLDVRCNSVHPAYVRTGIVEKVFDQLGEDAATRLLSKDIPMGRLGVPDDVAYAVIYLASHESRFVTASELVVDGGLCAA